MKFAVTYGVQCLASPWESGFHAPVEIPHDVPVAACPDCGREIDMEMFRLANRTMVVAFEFAMRRDFDFLTFGHAYQERGETRPPAQMVFEARESLDDLDLTITTIGGKWREIYAFRIDASRRCGLDGWMFPDVFNHPFAPTCDEESPPLGCLAPLVAGIHIWNTACELARRDGWLVFPRFAGREIWHGPTPE